MSNGSGWTAATSDNRKRTTVELRFDLLVLLTLAGIGAATFVLYYLFLR